MVYIKKMTPLEAKGLADDDLEKKIALEVCVERVEKNFGFELNWSEIVGMKYYINCFWGRHEKGVTDSPVTDAFHYFMVDYFGLDVLELGECAIRTKGSLTRGWKNYGSRFIGEESFKKYCRMNVNFWRDQRNLF